MKLAGLNRTTIEWAQNPDGSQGYTLNVFTGCLNHVKGMCKGGGFPCYAYRLANGRLRTRYLANLTVCPPVSGYMMAELEGRADPFHPRLWQDRMETLLSLRYIEKPMGIFLCDMSDWAGKGIPLLWQIDLLDCIKNCPQHRFYLLTKQPQNLIKFSPFPPNCFVGVSVTQNNQLADALKYLRQIEATVKFISFEPLLDRINLDL